MGFEPGCERLLDGSGVTAGEAEEGSQPELDETISKEGGGGGLDRGKDLAVGEWRLQQWGNAEGAIGTVPGDG